MKDYEIIVSDPSFLQNRQFTLAFFSHVILYQVVFLCIIITYTGSSQLYHKWSLFMCVKLFLLGRPGCGKSSAAKRIAEFIERDRQNWAVHNFKDYNILYQMAKEDILHQKFVLHEDNSFDVLDAAKLDEALHELEKIVSKHLNEIRIHQPDKNHLIIIELARENYDDAFEQFSSNFLADSYFLLINTEFEECRKRIKKRVKASKPGDLDNHNVSKFVMETYYRIQHPLTMENLLPRFQILNNNGPWNDFSSKLEPLIKKILRIN